MIGHESLLTVFRRASYSTFAQKRTSRTLPAPRLVRLLKPRELSQRLKALSEHGKVAEAVAMLKSSPIDAQNVPVWNTLIWECFKAKQFKLAFRLYTDVSASSPTCLYNGLIDETTRFSSKYQDISDSA